MTIVSKSIKNDPMPSDRLRRFVTEYRDSHELTYEQLAKRCGVSTKTAHNIAKGLHVPSVDAAYLICKRLNINPDLLTRRDV